ncbi:MAG: terminase small subunit [Sulfuricaulis sp.]
MDDLTEMQCAFVLAYVRGPGTAGNGTKSAVAAGYSAKSARVQAGQLLAKPHVMDAITREQRKALSGLSSVAILEAEKLLTDPATAAGTKVDLIRTILDRGGLAAPKEAAPKEKTEKPLNEMSLTELEEFIRNGQEQIQQLQKQRAGSASEGHTRSPLVN